MMNQSESFSGRIRRNYRENQQWLLELWNNQDNERNKLLQYYRWHFKELLLCVLLAFLLTRVDKVQQFFSAFAIEIKTGDHTFLQFAVVFALNGLVVFWLCYVFWHKPARLHLGRTGRLVFGDRRREDFEAYYKKPGGAWRVAMVSGLPMLLVNAALSIALLRDNELIVQRPSALSLWLDNNSFLVLIILALLYLLKGSLIRPRFHNMEEESLGGRHLTDPLTAADYDVLLGELWRAFRINLWLLPAGVFFLTFLLWFYPYPSFFNYVVLLFFVITPPLVVAFFLSSFSECLIIERKKEEHCKKEGIAFHSKFEKWYNGLMRSSYLVSVAIFLMVNNKGVTSQEWFSEWMFPVAMLMFIFIAYFQAIDLLIYNMTRLRVYLFFLFWIVLLVYFGQSGHYRLKFNGEVPKSGSLRRTGLETYFLTWAKDRFVANDSSDVFLVASEGGGSRSGAWTSAVLTQLDSASGGAFKRRCFAISAVSGGAVGTAATLALWDNAIKSGISDTTLYTNGKRDAYVARIFRRNYISTALAGIFFYDLLQQLPGPNLLYKGQYSRTDRHQDEEDNAVCAGLGEILGPKCLIQYNYLKKTNFLSLYYDNEWRDKVAKPKTTLPLFFPNTCRVEDGRRGIVSPILMDSAEIKTNPKDPFNAAVVDIIGIGRDKDPTKSLSLGEATSLSELFPYVNSPVFIDENTGSFMDGGAYENLGLTTLYEVKVSLKNICAAPDTAWIAKNIPDSLRGDFTGYLTKMRFKILLIYNSDNHGDEKRARYDNKSVKLFDPIVAMMQTPFGGHTDYIYHKVRSEPGGEDVIDFPMLINSGYDNTRPDKIVMSRWLSKFELDEILRRARERVRSKLCLLNREWCR